MTYPLDHIVIYSTDPEHSGHFYARLLGWLGFEKRRDHVFARDGLFIDIRTATLDSPKHERGMRGVDHLGFRADSVEAISRLQDGLVAGGESGGRLIEFANGDIALFVADPDGLRIEVTCYADPDADPVD